MLTFVLRIDRPPRGEEISTGVMSRADSTKNAFENVVHTMN